MTDGTFLFLTHIVAIAIMCFGAFSVGKSVEREQWLEALDMHEQKEQINAQTGRRD